MKVKLQIFTLVLSMTITQFCFASANDNAVRTTCGNRLTIILPAESIIESSRLTLGEVAVVEGENEPAAKAKNIELGMFTVPGQKITIDMPLIRSRLVCSGINESDFVLSGAGSIVVRQNTRTIKGAAFADSALSFLKNSIKEQEIAGWETLREPADMVLSNQYQDVELTPRLVSRGVTGQATVEVTAVSGGDSLESRHIVFQPKFSVRRAVTLTDVKAGSVFTTDNTRVEDVVANEPERANWAPPYGLVAARNLTAGTVIGASMAITPRPQVIIERNQTVCIRIERPGIVVTASGLSMQQGKLGEYIKVRNIDSQRVITAKVNEDGTVEPVI